MNQLEDKYKAIMRFNTPPPNRITAEIPNDETIKVSVKGRMNEWLICTDKQIYILKSGWATGNTNRIGNFHTPYANVSNAFVDFHISTGYFELLSGSMVHSKKSYWGSNDSNPQMSPNCIGIMSKNDAEKFEVACAYINAKSIIEKEKYSDLNSKSDHNALSEPVSETHNLTNQQDPSSVRCPKCGSANLQIYNEVQSKGVSGTKVCLFGICGLCGAGKTNNQQFWICKDCGFKFKA